MTRFYFHHPIGILILLLLFIHSCSDEVKTTPSEIIAESKPIPEIIGTPPPLTFYPGMENYTNLVSQYIRSIFQDSKGNYWFGPASQSVVRYDVKTLEYYSREDFFNGNESVKEDYGNSVHAITEDKNGNIWFGTDNGAVKYDGNIFRSYTEKDGLTNLHVGRKCILTDKSGNIWIGTAGGVFLYDPAADNAGEKCFSIFNLLPALTIKDIMEDHTGNIWFATQDNGVFCFDGKAVKNLREKEGLGDNYAGGMAQDKAGNFWFTMKGGICRYDGKTFTEFTTKDGLGGSEVWGIFIEKSGIIWISARGSTTRYDPSISDSKAFTVYTEKDGINCCVQSMYQDVSGNMWWGAGSGLYRFDGKRFYQVKRNGPW